LPEPHKTQFFCMRGNRAIHKRGSDFEADPWELYHSEQDFSEAIEVSEKYPEKLKELKELWWSEAEKYGSLPYGYHGRFESEGSVAPNKTDKIPCLSVQAPPPSIEV